MRFNAKALTFGLGVVLLPSIAQAQEPTATAIVDLNMRAGPANVYPVVGVISANDTVVLHGCVEANTWCEVSYGTERGWSYSEYLTFQSVAIAEGPQGLPPPVVYDGEAYFTQYYADRPFFEERDSFFGAVGGATVGALVFGPIGAAVGAVVGATIADPPAPVIAYVVAQEPQLTQLSGEVVVGAAVPEVVSLRAVPDYNYAYANINGQWVLVDPGTRQIVYVIR